ncbi:hypothetical protein [Bosea sp. AAP35]|uniref:hypothetical protein n=1 Tax=Bosea sp. AAP35 TaxID=1523417 RepID=UPI0006B98BDD|nr:hypothetical protein [Bosea sp. AAP35]
MLVLPLAACISPEEQRAADTQACSGYGFAQGTDAFANCMMTASNQRNDAEAADRRIQADQDAAARAAREAKDARDRDAWDRRTGQGIYASPPGPTQAQSGPMPALFDRNGNRNYDSSGTYIGGHGIGTLVDSPDKPSPIGMTPTDTVRQDMNSIDDSICRSRKAMDPTAIC